MFGIKNRNRLAKRLTKKELREELENLGEELEEVRADIGNLEATFKREIDKLREEIREQPVPKRDEGVSEAQVKREWFGEDEPV